MMPAKQAGKAQTLPAAILAYPAPFRIGQEEQFHGAEKLSFIFS